MKKKSQIPNNPEFVAAPPQPVAYTVTNGGSSSCPKNSADYYTDRNLELGGNYDYADTSLLGLDLENAKKELKDLCDEFGADDNSPQRQEFIDALKKESQQRYDDFVNYLAADVELYGENEPSDAWEAMQLADAAAAEPMEPFTLGQACGETVSDIAEGLLNPMFLPESSIAHEEPLYDNENSVPYGDGRRFLTWQELNERDNPTYSTFAAAAAAVGGLGVASVASRIQTITEAANAAIYAFNTQLPLGQTPLPLLKPDMKYDEFARVFPDAMFDRSLKNRSNYGKGGGGYERVQFCQFSPDQVISDAFNPARNQEYLIRDIKGGNPVGTAKTNTISKIDAKGKQEIQNLARLATEAMDRRQKGLKPNTDKNSTIARANKYKNSKKAGFAIGIGLALLIFVQKCVAAETAENENLNQECARKNKEIADAVKKFNDAKEALEKDVDEKNKKTKEDKPDLDSRCTPDGTPPDDNGVWPESGDIDTSWPQNGGWSNAARNDVLKRARAAAEKFKELLKPPCDIKPIDCRLYTIDQPQGNTN